MLKNDRVLKNDKNLTSVVNRMAGLVIRRNPPLFRLAFGNELKFSNQLYTLYTFTVVH